MKRCLVIQISHPISLGRSSLGSVCTQTFFSPRMSEGSETDVFMSVQPLHEHPVPLCKRGWSRVGLLHSLAESASHEAREKRLELR